MKKNKQRSKQDVFQSLYAVEAKILNLKGILASPKIKVTLWLDWAKTKKGAVRADSLFDQADIKARAKARLKKLSAEKKSLMVHFNKAERVEVQQMLDLDIVVQDMFDGV